MEDVKNMDIRYTQAGDEIFLKRWLSKEEEWKFFPFSNREEREVMIKNWMGFCDYKASLTGVIEGKPCAMATLFLMPFKKLAHQSLIYLMVEKKYRRKNVGTTMLKNLLHLSKNYFHHELVYVEIYDDPAILALLKKFHFIICAQQEGCIKEKDGKYRPKITLQLDF